MSSTVPDGTRHQHAPAAAEVFMSSIDDRLNLIIRELIANGITLEQAVEAFESKYIVAAMAANRGNVTRASKALGVHRNTLHNKLRGQSATMSAYVASVRPARRRAVTRGNGSAKSTRPRNPKQST